jgi:hypothetical protein
VTIPDAEPRLEAGSFARRAILDYLSIVLILAGAAGFDVLVWLMEWRAGLAVIFLYIAAVGFVVGMDREGGRR